MGPTLRLTLSSLRARHRGQLVAIVAVCTLAATAVVAGLAARTSAADRADAAYERAGRPDLVLYGSADALTRATDDDAVAAAAEPQPVLTDLSTEIDDGPVEVEVIGVEPDHLPEVGAYDLVDGRWPSEAGEDEVVVEQSLIATGVADVGGTIDVVTPSGPRALRVVGATVDLTDCFWPTCDPVRLFARPDLLADLNEGSLPTGHQAAYRLHDPSTAAEVGGRFLGDSASGIDGANNWPDTRDDILVIGSVFSAMVSGFGTFLLVAAAFVVAGATAARLVARQRTLGLLRAMGFTPRQVISSVWVEHLLLGAAGVLIGWVLGSLAAPVFEAGLDGVLREGASGLTLRPLVIAALLVAALLTASVLGPAWRAVRRPATEVLRDVPAAPGGGRRLAAVARRLGAGPSSVCGLRRTFARPGRAALAGGALVVAAAGAVVSAGFLGTLYDIADDPAVTGNPWDVAVVDVAEDRQPEVEAVLDQTSEVGAWFTEREVAATVDGAGYTVRIMGGDPAAADYVVQEGQALGAPDEAIVGYAFLDESGLDVGDPLTVDVDGTTLDLTIVGWYSDTADGGKMVQIREEALPRDLDEPLTYRVVGADGVSGEALADELDARLGGVADTQVLDVEGTAPATAAVLAMTLLLALIAVANLVVTTLAGARERSRALGVLRTIGASTSGLLSQTAVGTATIGLLAAVIGVPLGWIAYTALADGLTSGVGIGPGFASDPSLPVVAVVISATILLAALAGALATLGPARRPAAELVRYE